MLGCKSLTEREVRTLEMCFQRPRTRVFFQLCLYTGLRPAEALALRVGDVVGTDRLLLHRRLTKGRVKSRSIKLHPTLIRVLQTYCEGRAADEPLFLARAGRPLTYRVLHREFAEAVQRAGLCGKVAPHSGRKTFAARVYAASGKDIVTTGKLLGHSDPKNTMMYLSVGQEVLDGVVEMVPWGGLK